LDGRINNGGHSTKGFAGRKPKSEEQQLIERLSPMADNAYEALDNGIKEGNPAFIKLWFEYMFGKPKQTIDQSNTGDLQIKVIRADRADNANTTDTSS